VYPPGYPGAPHGERAEQSLHETAVEIAPPAPAKRVRAAAREIVRENRQAASLTPSEAREILTARVSELIQGGRAAILTPEHRARAVRIARMLGVRDFDAHLVIAVVQDRARRGEIEVHRTDLFVPESMRAAARTRGRLLPESGAIALLQIAAATLLAAALLLGAVNWLG
jgi:hypothetical protein